MNIAGSMSAAVLAITFYATAASGSPETLVLQSPRSGKTSEVQINYDKLPKVAPPPGFAWNDFNWDTAWHDTLYGSEITHVRTNHAFRARWDGKEGVGWEYIAYHGSPYSQDEDRYHAGFGFYFTDDTLYQTFGVDGAHYRENPDIPEPNRILATGMNRYFVLDSYQLPDYTNWRQDAFLLIDRYQGWGLRGGPDSQEGGDIPAGKNGKVGLRPWGPFAHFP